MEKFVCLNCNYRFSSEFEQKENKCPYCGENKLIAEPSAEDLLEE